MKAKIINQQEIARINAAFEMLEFAQKTSHSRDVYFPPYINELRLAVQALVKKTCLIHYDEILGDAPAEMIGADSD